MRLNEILDYRTARPIAVREAVRRATIDIVSGETRDVVVTENPSRAQMSNLLAQWDDRARMCVDDHGNLLVWNASEAIHGDVERALGLGDDCIRGFIYPEGIGVRWEGDDLKDYTPTLQSSKGVVRAFGSNAPVFTAYDDGL